MLSPPTAPSTGGAGFFRTMAEWLSRTWYIPNGSSFHPLSPLLRLGSQCYARGLQIDQRKAQEQKRGLPAPVISVGNLVVGGTGKTPFTLWLANHMHRLGLRPAILSRGYGRSSTITACVPSEGETSSLVHQFGDEPVLMARKARPVSVWVGRKRWESGKWAIESGSADVLLLDDGFQHLALERDLDLVLVDAERPFGNGSLLPLGPLREPVEHLKRAHAIILTRAYNEAKTRETRRELENRFPRKPIFACRHRLTGFRVGIEGPRIPLEALQNRAAVAFAGIAKPETFFQSLRELGIHLPVCFHFPDHYPFAENDALLLLESTRSESAHFLVTTEKDVVRFPASLQSALLSAELEVDFGQEREAFCSFLDESLNALARIS